MPRRLAIAISQAPGLRGTPSVGHCSSAATSASCARSSARPTSRVIRASAAISFGDSIFQTASIVLEMSGESNHLQAYRYFLPNLSSKPAAAACTSAGKSSISWMPRTSMISPLRHRRALGPLDGFFLRLDLDHPVAADAFLGFGEWTVGDLGLAAVVADAHAGGRRLQAVEAEQDAGLGEVLVVFHHLADGLGVRHPVRCGAVRSPWE